jgi:hypothetical protein
MSFLLAEDIRPARGADLAAVLPATGVLAAFGAVAIALCVLYRRDRLPRVSAALTRLEERTGRPAWASVPAAISGVGLLTAGFGYYWDVAVHIGNGRDRSPFGTAAHWPIVLGLCALTLAGILAVALDRNTDGGAAVHLPGGLRCSLGAVLVLLCGSVSLLGFPLDDLWHHLFGQDVTLWSPTHIQMIAGASLTTLANWVLLEEGRRRSPRPDAHPRGALGAWARFHPIALAGAFLVGLSTLQAEFDYGVPQFNPLYHPVLLALAAGLGLTTARVVLGRGGALYAVLFFLGLRGLWALVIGGAFGLTVPHQPLYLVEALLVEAAAIAVGTTRQVRFGLLAGLLVGTVGFAAEWAYGQVAFPLPWRTVLLPDAAVLAAIAGVAGGVLGATVGRSLLPQARTPERRAALLPALAFASAVGVLALVLPMNQHSDYTAAVDVQARGDGTADLTIRLDPPTMVDDAAWFNVTSWQGGQRLVPSANGLAITPLVRVAEGVYRTSRPVPVAGEWKSLLRLTTTRSSDALPIYLPADKGIPAAEVPASPHFERAFVADRTILQREQTGGSPLLKNLAYGGLSLLAVLWVLTLSLGLGRLGRTAQHPLPPLRITRRRTGELVA